MPLPLIAAGGMALAGAAINANAQSRANREAQQGAANAANQASQAWGEISKAYGANEQLLRDYERRVGDVYTPDMLAKASEQYKAMLSNPNDLFYEPTEFDYGKSIEDFYDKAWETNANAQQRALERSAANAGGLYSSGLINNTASLMSENATKAYKDARDAYFQDKGLALEQWKAYNDMLKNKASSKLGVMGAYGGAMSNGLGYYGDITSARISNQNSAADAYANMSGTYSNLVSQAGNRSVNPWASFKAPTQSVAPQKLY
jgi:hypothetical protein